jgi:hypothetical protein
VSYEPRSAVPLPDTGSPAWPRRSAERPTAGTADLRMRSVARSLSGRVAPQSDKPQERQNHDMEAGARPHFMISVVVN